MAVSGGTPDRDVAKFWDGSIPWISPKDFGRAKTDSSEEYITETGAQARGLTVFDPGTVLMVVRSGILRHTLPVTRLLVSAAVNQDVKALIPKTQAISSSFLASYLEVRQIDVLARVVKHSTTVQSVNTDQLYDLLIPTPPLSIQQDLVAALEASRVERQRKLEEADVLLAGLDGFVLDALSLTLPPIDTRTVYAIRARDAQQARKLYPDYFHPERVITIREIEACYKGSQAPSLSSIADFVREQCIVSPNDNYLGLANVQPNTGERIESTDEDGKGNCFSYIEGDVLFARLRPYLNKVYRAESNGVCSTEFHVIRVHKENSGRPRFIPDYLAAVLRSSIVLSQTRHMMTGNTHPRLTNEDVVNLIIPNPDREIQQRIATEVARRRAKARQLRSDAESLWNNAKRRFEEELLGPEPALEESKTGNKKGGKRA